MMKYSKVEGFNSLMRDEVSHVVINTNINEYHKYLSEKEKKISEKTRIESIENELSDLKTDVSEIKDLLKHIVKSL